MNIVLTIAVGEAYQSISKLTHPTLSSYAKSIGADFLVVSEQKISKLHPDYEKFVVHDLLKTYDRVLLIDTDVIVRPDCPNLFDLVPENKLGMYDEGLLTTPEEKAVHRRTMELAFSQHSNFPMPEMWDHRFYNFGLAVISKIHLDLFLPPKIETFGNYWAQSYFNVVLQKNKTEMFDIGHKFNRMPYVDSKVNEHRLKSYIVHYAGIQEVGDLIQTDLALWDTYLRNPEYFL